MKRISPGTVTVAVLAILFGLVTAYAVRQYLRPDEVVPAPAPAEQTPTIGVLVPRFNLPQYTRIQPQDVHVVQVPLTQLPDGKPPEGAIRVASQALYRVTKQTIMAGRPILDEHLYGIGETPRLADQLSTDERAVTLTVTADSAIDGMIQPESYVDINMTVQDEHPDLQGMATVTLLRRVRVLATSNARYPRHDDRPRNMRNITVAVLPKQANKLILAQRYGTLNVTLCSNDGDTVVRSEEDRELTNPYDLLGLVAEAEPVAIQQKAQIWRGGSMTEITFGASEIQEAENATALEEGREPTPIVPQGVRPSAALPDRSTDKLPTLAPIPDSSALPAESRTELKPSGQEIYVPVEAEGA